VSTDLAPGRAPEQEPRVLRLLGWIEGLIAGLLVLAVLGLVTFQVTTRYLLNSPVSWSEELARFALIWLTFVGAGYVASRGAHITVVVGDSFLGRRGAQALQVFAGVMVVAVCAALALQAPEFLRTAGRTSSPAAGIPMGYVYGAAALGFVLIGLHTAARTVFVLRHPDLAVGAVRTTELPPEPPPEARA
jgi:TRAP-type transport system small permease protein